MDVRRAFVGRCFWHKKHTAQGKEIAEKELARLNELVSIASEIIGGAV